MQNDNVGALCSNPFRISGWCQRRQTLRETLRSTGCAKVQFAGLGNWLARPTPPGALREMDFFLYKANASFNEGSAGFISKPLASMSPENVPRAGLAWEKPGSQC